MLDDVHALFSSDPALYAGSVFLISLVVGSFLNVVIYRLPIMLERQWRTQAAELLSSDDASAGGSPAKTTPAPPERFTLVTPRSACPNCMAPIKAWQNIPVLSWLMLRGRCASCKAPISARYPLVELATGILSAWVAWHFGFGWPAACALVVTWALVALTAIDFDRQLLPDDITLPLMWAGLLAAAVLGPTVGASVPVSVRDSIIGAASGYISLWLVFHAFRLVTGKEGIGYGDFKLFAALGAWLGWQMLPLVILLAAATGAVLGILMIVLRGRDRSAPMPFGPYLAAAGWIAMMYGDRLINGYLRVTGLTHP
jgi:leader peptidase (prepilin peptidase) / N-methyltransferase